MKNLDHHSLHFNDRENGALWFEREFIIDWGNGWFYFLFYSVQDCLRSTLALPEVMYTI